jgi:hypothetical protein
MKKILLLALWSSLLFAEELQVNITREIATVEVYDAGQKVIIQRTQDTEKKLTDDYTKTSRACPPFCIQPTRIAEGIENIAELELLDFMQTKVLRHEGVIVDARLKSWFEIETIPSAINIPYKVMKNASKEKAKKIFQILGMRIKADGTWDFSAVKELAIFCNGVWCEQSKYFIDGMMKYHYPKDKLFYYRSGFQGWKLLGLTTVVHKEITK